MCAFAPALTAHGYVPLAELHHEESVALHRAKQRSGARTESVLVETRWRRPSDTARSAEAEYELLKRLHVYGVAPEPVAWFRNDEHDTIVMRDEPSEGLVLGSEYVRKQQQQGLVMENFFPFARALLLMLAYLNKLV